MGTGHTQDADIHAAKYSYTKINSECFNYENSEHYELEMSKVQQLKVPQACQPSQQEADSRVHVEGQQE